MAAGKPWWECELAGCVESIQGSLEREMFSFLLFQIRSGNPGHGEGAAHVLHAACYMDCIDSWVHGLSSPLSEPQHLPRHIRRCGS